MSLMLNDICGLFLNAITYGTIVLDDVQEGRTIQKDMISFCKQYFDTLNENLQELTDFPSLLNEISFNLGNPNPANDISDVDPEIVEKIPSLTNMFNKIYENATDDIKVQDIIKVKDILESLRKIVI